jgi:HEAT repeat protein
MERTVYFALLIGLLCCQTSGAAPPPEPKYEGKPIAYWVERLQKAETNLEQTQAAEAIRAFGVDAGPAVPALVEMLKDRSPWFREMIRATLCAIGPGAKAAVPALIRALEEKSARDPSAVITVLGSIGPAAKDATPLLIAALEDPSLRREAVEALCGIGPAAKDAIPAIKRAIRSAKTSESFTPVVAPVFLLNELHKLGPDVVPLLVEELDEEGRGYQIRSAEALGKIGPPARSAVPHLMKLLEHGNPDLRLEAACALWKIEKTDAVVGCLKDLLKDPDCTRAERAARTLGEIGAGAKIALPALKAAALHHEQFPVHEAARCAILKIKAATK